MVCRRTGEEGRKHALTEGDNISVSGHSARRLRDDSLAGTYQDVVGVVEKHEDVTGAALRAEGGEPG